MISWATVIIFLILGLACLGLIAISQIQQASLARWSRLLSRVTSIMSEVTFASLQGRIWKSGKYWDEYSLMLNEVGVRANLKILTMADVENLRLAADKLYTKEEKEEK